MAKKTIKVQEDIQTKYSPVQFVGFSPEAAEQFILAGQTLYEQDGYICSCPYNRREDSTDVTLEDIQELFTVYARLPNLSQ